MTAVEKPRSTQRFLPSPLGIKAWLTQVPTCAAARPGQCACCGAAAQPVGGPLVIVGHGVIQRQVRGPMEASGAPQRLLVTVRRYRCRACRTVLMVGPSGLLRCRWYTAGAIGAAMGRYASGSSATDVRARTSPDRSVGSAARERWITLARWIDAAGAGALFGIAGIAGKNRREVAEQVMTVLAARGGYRLGDDMVQRAFLGALIAA